MIRRTVRLDAPFWAFLLAGSLGLAALGCFGVAAAQMKRGRADILTTDNAPPPADL